MSANEPVILPAPVVDLNLPPQTKWEREYQAFQRLLPQLLPTHRGQSVAVHDEQVVDSDADDTALTFRVLARLGNVDIHVGLVTEEPGPLPRIPHLREIRRPGSPS